MKKRITIGLFIDSYYPLIDGVYMVVDNYARRLLKYANVIVFAPDYKTDYDDSKFPYIIVRCKALKLPIVDYSMPIPKLDREFKKQVETYNLDIVHIHSPFMIGKMGVDYAKKHNIPVIATMHSQFKQDFERTLKSEKLADVMTQKLIKIFNECDECWAVNNEVAKIYFEEYKYKQMPLVMNNATDMKPLKNNKKENELINKKHNIKSDEKVFLFVGRINNLKNVFFIVESLNILKSLKHNFKFKMLFVGTGQDEEELKALIKKYNMQNTIIMCGKIVDRNLLAAYYSRADLFLFPSLYDASSIVQIEAASQKTPSLFIKGAATTSTVTDGKNGFISKATPEDYANYIIKIMEDDKLYRSVSENAYRDLYKNWDDEINNVYKKYLKLINDKNNM